MTPTEEQQAAIELSLTTEDLTIEALAGCGKTSTLKLISDAKRNSSGAYIAFNKAIVVEAAKKFPSNVQCSTAHSLAFQAIGRRYASKLNSSRQLYRETARLLGIYNAEEIEVEGTKIKLPVNEQVHAVKGVVERFCQGGDDQFSSYHIPVPDLLRPWGRQYREAIAPLVLPVAERMWQDIQNPKGQVAFSHNHYLKMWQLSRPKINADFILFDEAQDANGVMLAIVQNQEAQKIFVGDSFQQIYSWNGAVNAMAKTSGNRTWLTESWRFGQGVADVANQMLARLDSPAMLIGRGPDSVVGPLRHAEAMLYRTNGACIAAMVEAHDLRRRFHLVGGVTQLEAFTRAARKLINRENPMHPELNCFESWADVVTFAETDEADGDLPRMVKMIETHGAARILAILSSNETDPRDADVVVSTAHKSKGCEWDSVIIGSDFGSELGEEEQRLLYVAVTRAKKALDHTAVKGHFTLKGSENHECA